MVETATKSRKDQFALQKEFLRFVGISLEEKETIWYNIYASVVFIIIASPQLVTTHAILVNMNRYGTLIENLTFNIPYISIPIKVMITLFLRKELIKALKVLQSGVFVPNVKRGKEEEKLMEQSVTYSNFQSMVLFVMSILFAFSATVDIMVHRIFQRDSTYWRLPFGDFCLFSITKNPNFTIVWIYQTITSFVCCMAYCMIESFIAAVMVNLKFQCKILQNLIKRSIQRSRENMIQTLDKQTVSPLRPPKIHWKHLREMLKEIVVYHTDLINIADRFESLFSFEILNSFVALTFAICFSMLSVTSTEGFNFRSLQKLLLVSGTTILQLMTAYWGNEVTSESLTIGEAYYGIDFAEVDIRFQKALALMIQRAQKPILFTVGKFAPLTLNTFVVVMKASYSYYMFLNRFS